MGNALYRRSNSLLGLTVYLKKAQQKSEEIFLTRVATPFDFPPFPNLQVSPLGFVIKKDMLLIYHLFNLVNRLLNSSTAPSLRKAYSASPNKVHEFLSKYNFKKYLDSASYTTATGHTKQWHCTRLQ